MARKLLDESDGVSGILLQFRRPWDFERRVADELSKSDLDVLYRVT
jgi:hypothetical protein